jgi:hypothetical protein
MSASLTKLNYVHYQAWKQPLNFLLRGCDYGIDPPQRYLAGLHRTFPKCQVTK